MRELFLGSPSKQSSHFSFICDRSAIPSKRSDSIDKHKMYEMSTDVYFKLLATEPTDHFFHHFVAFGFENNKQEEEDAKGQLISKANSKLFI